MDEKYTQLYDKLSRLQWLLHRQQLKNHAEHGPMGDPTRGQGRVMAMLKLQPDISTKDLSYLLGIRQQSLNELLNKLEKKGYVVRVPSEEDKRIMLVRLTDKGQEMEPEQNDFGSIFDCLKEDEQQTLNGYLDRIIKSLEAQLGVSENEDQWMDQIHPRMGRGCGHHEGHGHARHGRHPEHKKHHGQHHHWEDKEKIN